MYELASKLRSLGLTEYEARCYLALLKKPDLTAVDVSGLSEVPLPRVYGILEQLEAKGFIKSQSGRPKRFEAYEPKHAIQQYMKYRKNLLEDEIDEISRIFAGLQSDLEELYYRTRLRIKPEALLEPLADLYEMERRSNEIISSAEEEIVIFTELFSWFHKVKKNLKLALKRGIRIRVLMCMNTPMSKSIARSLLRMGVQVKVAPEPWYPARGMIVDESKLLFLIWAAKEKERYWQPMLYKPHYTENKGLICVFMDAFERRWLGGRIPS